MEGGGGDGCTDNAFRRCMRVTCYGGDDSCDDGVGDSLGVVA